MLSWLSQNAQGFNVLVNVGMLIIWLTYLQLFLAAYRRQRRANILINRGAGHGLDGRCLISNMSAEAIHVQSILAHVEADGRRWSLPVTDVATMEENAAGASQTTRQGPLAAGEFMDIGSFRDVVRRVLKSGEGGHFRPTGEAEVEVLEFHIVAIYSAEDLPVGARRRFAVSARDGELLLRPETIDTVQIRSRRERQAIRSTLRQYL